MPSERDSDGHKPVIVDAERRPSDAGKPKSDPKQSTTGVSGAKSLIAAAERRRFLFGGRVIDPATRKVRACNILIENGRITRVGRDVKSEGAKLVDCRRKYIAPGFIDLHCHLREPGNEDAETIASGTRAALAGGFLRVCPMPNTEPPVDTEALVRFELHRAEEAGFARVLPVGCCTRGRQGKELAEIAGMKTAGVVAVSDDGSWISDAQVMRRVLEYAKAFDIPVISHCELAEMPGVANEGLISTRLGLAGSPVVAEAAAASRDILLAEYVGARIHIAHVSAAATVDVVRRAKERGVEVTAETCPHYFTLTEEALVGFDTNFKVNPPLRTEQDRQAVISGLADGTIDAIATDHAPHTRQDKDLEFDLAPPGIIGLETAFSLGYEQLVLSGQIELVDYIRLLTTGPARVLGLPQPSIEPGAPADLVILDLEARWTYTPDLGMSRSHNSPFFGCELKGRVLSGVLGEEQFWLLHPA
ncbi:MAG: dihydroorotase [candidate division WOR-3 bacterium]